MPTKKKTAKKKTKKKTKRRLLKVAPLNWMRRHLRTGGLPEWAYEQLQERLRKIREEIEESGNCKHCGASLYRGALSSPAKKGGK
jgi:hypothetical protein